MVRHFAAWVVARAYLACVPPWSAGSPYGIVRKVTGDAQAGGGAATAGPRGGERVTVIRDRAVRAGVRWRGVVAYDWAFADDSGTHVQRSFVLLDDGVQINQPVLFPREQQGWWYCDLVSVVDEGQVVHVDDMWIDFIVGPPDHPYRVLDLDEYAEALEDGRLTQAEAVQGLRRAQRFLEMRLNRRHDTARTWPDFPPDPVEFLLTADLPQDWLLLET